MNRAQLAHVMRAASEIAGDPHLLIIGSQSILATYDEDDLPDAATASMEVDVAFLVDPDDQKADRVDGAIGELSMFHEQNGFYAQGVSVTTAVLPDGWRDRVVRWASQSTGMARAAFLEPHDCVISKLVAYREKDLAFAAALIEAGLVAPELLRERARCLPTDTDSGVSERLLSWLEQWPRA